MGAGGARPAYIRSFQHFRRNSFTVTEVKEDRKHASARATADHLCIDPTTFSKYLNQGVIKRQPRHIGYDLDECRRARFKFLENQAAGRSGVDGGELLSKQRARLAHAQADAQVLRTGIMSGEYVRLATFSKVLDRHIMAMRERFLQLPRVSAEALLPILRSETDMAAAEDVIRELTYAAMEDVADGKVLAAEVRSESHERRARADNIEEPIA
jgi:phage terminase Nu1 subunit (DNA packaging protein)